ncbi:hypothetical protein AVEN_246375-1 [Araneus ventricosus]|uniref:F-box domain-containing protein n=1 Tax=Araneus ventricosus TaxID=182803 RepID=A0A4Y2Q4N1_ARAVE|nr:hypothetical protein AVEN_246375-1 [Araneus ventricosus]
MFRHVVIEGNCARNCLMKNFCRHFVEFLQILTSNTQLISVKFLHSSTYLLRIDPPTYNGICRDIADFLASQRHLKGVEFDRCFFYFPESVEILRKLSESTKESLTHLKLQNFLRYGHKDIGHYSNAAQKLPMLTDLPNLKTLETDYSFIFENMVARQTAAIQTVINSQTLGLSKLILHYLNEYTDIEDFQRLTSTNWGFMKRLYPDLQVELIIQTGFPTRRELEFYIVPNMPITRLDYKCLEFEMGIETHACKKLKCLELFTISPISGIDDLLETWLENRPESLQKVIIDVSNVYEEDDFPGWINLTDHASLLKLMGLNIRPKNFCSNDEYSKYAKKLLIHFVKTTIKLYGCQYVTSNMHGHIHLVDSVDHFGPLYLSSSFPFENYLQHLKKIVRKGDKPLQQVVKRLSEIMSSDSFLLPPVNIEEFPRFLKPHFRCPLLITSDPNRQYSSIQF